MGSASRSSVKSSSPIHIGYWACTCTATAQKRLVSRIIENGRHKLAEQRPWFLPPILSNTGPRAGLREMCATRLTIHWETYILIDARQYGFRKNASTIDARYNVLEFIRRIEKTENIHMLSHIGYEVRFQQCAEQISSVSRRSSVLSVIVIYLYTL